MIKILYTGARSGIAKSVIDKLKNEDYFIYLTVETESQLSACKKLYSNYKNIECMKLDITDKNDLNKIKNLDIDILVSNAAIGVGGSVKDIDIDKLKHNFEVNVFSNFNLVQIVLNKMIKNNKGKIIMMSSLASILPIPFLGSYAATKASISKLTKCLDLELKLLKSDINVILIEPGLYKTGFNQLMLDDNDYFSKEIALIKEKESFLFNLFEHKNFTSISNKIYKAIVSDNPKFCYRAPMYQVILAKIYQIFN